MSRLQKAVVILTLASGLVFYLGYRLVGARFHPRRAEHPSVASTAKPPNTTSRSDQPAPLPRQRYGRMAGKALSSPAEAEGLRSFEEYSIHDPTSEGQLPAQRDDAALVQRLIHQVRDSSDPDSRTSALRKLGFLKGNPEILLTCTSALADADEDVRMEAALALDTLHDPAAIPALQQALKDEPSKEIRKVIGKTIAELSRFAAERDK